MSIYQIMFCVGCKGLNFQHLSTHTHTHTHIQELIAEYCGSRPLEEWKFLLRIRVLPKTPQHLQGQDPVAFQYYYDQVWSMCLYLSLIPISVRGTNHHQISFQYYR